MSPLLSQLRQFRNFRGPTNISRLAIFLVNFLHPLQPTPPLSCTDLPAFHSSRTLSSPSPPHCGNGLLADSLNPTINSRTRARRASNRSTSISRALRSPPYHSGGIISAIAHAVSGARFSMRLSQGSKLGQPVTPR